MDNGPETTMDQLKETIRSVLAEFVGEDHKQLRATRVREIDKITRYEQRAIDSLNWLQKITGRRAFPSQIVAYFAGHSETAPAFINARKDLRRKGWIEHTFAGYMQLTPAGLALSKTEMYARKQLDKKEAAVGA